MRAFKCPVCLNTAAFAKQVSKCTGTQPFAFNCFNLLEIESEAACHIYYTEIIYWLKW